MSHRHFSRLDHAYHLATSKKEYDSAIAICSAVIETDPGSPHGYRKRAAIHALRGDPAAAITDITKALELEPADPADLFFRGWWKLDMDDPYGAIEDLTSALSIAESIDFHAHDQSAYFFRALANARLGRMEDAREDCAQVDDDFVIFLRSGRHSKADVLRLATPSTSASRPPSPEQ